MLLSISLSRLIFYFLLIGLLPLVFVLMEFLQKRKALLEMEQRIASLTELIVTNKQKQSQNISVRNYYLGAEHYYIDRELESLSFLQKEKEALEKIIQSEHFSGNERVQERYAFISGKNNRLSFTESNALSENGIQEITEILAHPVELDADDLKEVLARIEGRSIEDHIAPAHAPQLIVTDFQIEKKKTPHKNEVFEMNLKLIKREFCAPNEKA